MQHQCRFCAASFMGRAGVGYCSAGCRIKAGNEFAKSASRRVCTDCSAQFATNAQAKFTKCESCRPIPRKQVLYTCEHCKTQYKKRRPHIGEGERFCSRECAFIGVAAERREAAAHKPPPSPFCAYSTAACVDCGCGLGGRGKLPARCKPCTAEWKERSYRAAKAAILQARKTSAPTITCPDCGGVYCALGRDKYIKKKALCVPCAHARSAPLRRKAKSKRRAVERGAAAEGVDPFKVFKRDGWACRLCGIDTPRELRGSYEHNAPELDHIVALARGGSHTYANTQCLCRSCNGFKSDRTMAEVESELAA
ncbi:MAG: HNH endonuclease [Alphaproteobacteria bacterium]